MDAAALRDRAIRTLAGSPTPEQVAEATAWAQLAVSASISETGATRTTGDPQ